MLELLVINKTKREKNKNMTFLFYIVKNSIFMYKDD